MAISAGLGWPPSLSWDAKSSSLRLAGDLYWPTSFGSVTLTPTAKVFEPYLASLSASGQFHGATAPTTAAEKAYPEDVAVDAAGNTYVVGSFEGGLTAGSFRLSAQIDEGGTKVGPFVVKVSPTGAVLWAATFGDAKTTYLTVRNVAVGHQGVYLGGEFHGTVPFGTKSVTATVYWNTYVAKLSASTGQVEWVARAGADEEFGGLAVDASDSVFITGGFYGDSNADFGGTILNGHGADDEDIYVAKLTPDGEFAWASSGGSHPPSPPGTTTVYIDTATGIAVDATGGVYITGLVWGPADFGAHRTGFSGKLTNIFVAKLDAKGSFVWATNGTGDGTHFSGDIVSEANGDSYITGSFTEGVKFGTVSLNSRGKLDGYVVKVSPSGQFLWARSAGGTDGDEGWRLAHDGNGHLFVSGWFRGAVDFEGTTLNGGGLSTYVWMIPNP